MMKIHGITPSRNDDLNEIQISVLLIFSLVLWRDKENDVNPVTHLSKNFLGDIDLWNSMGCNIAVVPNFMEPVYNLYVKMQVHEITHRSEKESLNWGSAGVINI